MTKIEDVEVTSRFDLETAIMNSWNTADDIGIIAEMVSSDDYTHDELLNALIGLQQLHNMRCKKTFDLFEQLIESGDIV